MAFYWRAIPGFIPALLEAAQLTILITLIAIVIGSVIGVVMVAGRVSRWYILRLLSGIYIESIRNTPALLQIFIVFFGLPSTGVRMSAFVAGSLALGLNAGAYLAEIFRSGLLAVPKGSQEAATALAFSKLHTTVYITAPLAMRAAYPAFCNLVIMILLASSLLSAVSVYELTGMTNDISTKTFLTFEVYSISAVLYIFLNLAVSLVLMLAGRLMFPLRSR